MVPQPALDQDIAHDIEAICHAFVDAVNERRLSLDDPVWQYMAPIFRADADFPGHGEELDLSGLLETIKRIIEANPEHRMRILTLSSEIHKSGNRASVYMTTEIHGVPAGVIRQNVAVFEFRKLDGLWRGVRYQGLRGMGGLQNEFGGF